MLLAHGISILSHSCFTVVITDGAQVSGFPISTCSLWDLLGVERPWHQQPITYRLHFGVWCSGMVTRKGSYSKLALYWVNWELCIQSCTSCKTSMPYHSPGEQSICNYFLFRLQSSLDSGYLYSSVYVPAVHQESLLNAQTPCQST